jgi:3-phosphoshikimate 1-carboxyvinyltransferase
LADYVIRRSYLQGEVAVPSSKSHSIRAVLFAAIANGTSTIDNLLESPDVDAAIQAAQLFGATVVREGTRCLITGVNGQMQVPANVIDAGNSGLVLRFAGAFAALINGYTVITGDASVRSQRLVQPLIDGLRGLGALAESTRNNGLAPLIVRGPMHPGVTHLSGEDSQPVSALLAAAAWLKGRSEIRVESPGELPWVNLTLSWLERLGVHCEHRNFNQYVVEGGHGWAGFQMAIPGDLSTAAFPIAAALITQSELTVANVDLQDVQGDKKIVDVLRQMGARIEVDERAKTLRVMPSRALQGVAVDLNDFIDALPVLAVVGCFASGETRLFNATMARYKECDRVAGIARELRRMGAQIIETPDGLIIHAGHLHGAEVGCYGDHRMAMALAVAGLNSSGATVIRDIDCVNKTYRWFAEHLQHVGAHIQVVSRRGFS